MSRSCCAPLRRRPRFGVRVGCRHPLHDPAHALWGGVDAEPDAPEIRPRLLHLFDPLKNLLVLVEGDAAVAEFAREGYGGARVDRISKAAKSNDRMLYYYFKSKEKLFHHVIEHCYADLVAREEALDLDFSRPREALAALVAFNWNYYWDNPELLSILASENLFKGRHVKNNIRGIFANTQLSMLDRVIESGVKRGVFRPDCDRFLLYLSILSLTYFYRANLYTLSNYMQIDLADQGRRKAWLTHVQAMIDDLVRRRA